MRPTKSLLRYTVAVTLASFGTLYAGDFKKLGYETPAYVDLEFTEMRVNEPAGTLAINIIRTGDFRQTTTVDYQTVADSASETPSLKTTSQSPADNDTVSSSNVAPSKSPTIGRPHSSR